jgi:hypothetical protein
VNNLIPADYPLQLTDLGLTFSEDLSFEQWADVGRKIGQVARTSLFWVGDWLNYGQDRWNGGNRFEKMPDDQRQRYEDAMKMTGLELATLQKASYVARQIPLSDRCADLTFSHHRLIARVKDDSKRREWLKKTEDAQLSTRRLRASLNADRVVPERELSKPAPCARITHLYWIQRLVSWWAEAKAMPDYEEMTREQLEAVIDDFGPILGMVDELRRKAETATAYLDE